MTSDRVCPDEIRRRFLDSVTVVVGAATIFSTVQPSLHRRRTRRFFPPSDGVHSYTRVHAATAKVTAKPLGRTINFLECDCRMRVRMCIFVKRVLRPISLGTPVRNRRVVLRAGGIEACEVIGKGFSTSERLRGFRAVFPTLCPLVVTNRTLDSITPAIGY